VPSFFAPDTHRALLRDLKEFLRASESVLATWDAYAEENTDLDGWPLDNDAYGRHAAQRDADTAAAFENIREGAHLLLATAETQLVHLPAHAVQSSWIWQLNTLRTALEELDSRHEQWLELRAELPAEARPGTPLFDDALADHYADAWSSLDDWATNGQAIFDINSAARHAPSPLAPRPTTTVVPSAGHSGAVRR
jgi:hypothetical protein